MAKHKKEVAKKNDLKKEDISKNKSKEAVKENAKSEANSEAEKNALEKLPPEVKEKLKATKEKLDKFQKKIVDKFEQYIVGVSLLPPPKHKPESEEEKKKLEGMKDKYHVLILIDDTEPTKISKEELKEKLTTIMATTAKEIDPNIIPQTLLLSELWQNCYDQKHELLKIIALSAPIYDTGMLNAIKIAEIHKSMVLKKFEKYIVTYVLAGSLVQGKATKESDIDVFLVIDDTDVKKMTRTELRDKLRAIIIGMGIEAGEITGVRNKLNIQVYILTDFWDSVREANPVIFTFLRDGVPFYDRGIFMPWKQLLKMGKIKPSPEAIDMYLSSGEQMLGRIKAKLKDIGTEDFFWSILTPSQASLMMYGIPPPTPKEAPVLMREIFVKKEGLLEEEYVKILENVIQTRKDFEHGKKKDITGKEIDRFLEDCDKYMKRLKRLFTQIEKVKEEETMVNIYDTVQTIVRDVLKLEKIDKVKEEEILKIFEEKLITTGKVPTKFLRTLSDIIKAKESYDAGKLTKTEISQTKKDVGELIKFLIDYMQRKRMKDLEKVKLRIKHGEKIGEVTLLGNTAFITMDATSKEMQKAEIKQDGSLGTTSKCTDEEYEKSLAKIAITHKILLKEPLFESLKKIFGKDYEVII